MKRTIQLDQSLQNELCSYLKDMISVKQALRDKEKNPIEKKKYQDMLDKDHQVLKAVSKSPIVITNDQRKYLKVWIAGSIKHVMNGPDVRTPEKQDFLEHEKQVYFQIMRKLG